MRKIFIIWFAFGVSSNGRTRDFGSLYHGSNPCAPTNNLTRHCAGLIIGPWPRFAARNERCRFENK